MDEQVKKPYGKKKHEEWMSSEVFRLGVDMKKAQTQIRTLAAGERVTEDLEAKLTKLKETLAAIKLRQSRGVYLDDDKYRTLGLETEIGKTVLQMDGIL
jgi:hypothetical protein